MAKTTKSVFDEFSDDESINTTTTAESDYDSQKEYAVERILAERVRLDGEMEWLIKWEGYGLYASLWEKREQINHDVLFTDWDEDKRVAAQGGKSLFDVADWYEAKERHDLEKEEKHRRRVKKRRKRGETIPAENEDSDFEEQIPTTEAPKRTKAKTPTVKRKGVAQTVLKTGSRNRIVVDDDEEEGEVHTSDADSLFGEPKQRNSVPGSPQKTKAKTKTTAPRSTYDASTSMKFFGGPKKKPSADAAKPIGSKKPVQKGTAARKSAPSTVPTGKPTEKKSSSSNVFAGDWAAEKKRKQRPRVSGETPKDSMEPKFRNLSEQNRYQKYSRNEPAPDPNALLMVDPRTGRVGPLKTVPSREAANTPNAYGRRTPPPASKPRSPTPPSPEISRTVQPQNTANVENVIGRANDWDEVPQIAATDPRKQITCKHWLAGTCWRTADTCPYAHSYQGEPEVWRGKKQTTCFYWKNGGKCRKTAEECDFAHWDTGVTAGPPGTFRRKSTVNGAQFAGKESDLMVIENASRTPVPPPLQSPNELPPQETFEVNSPAIPTSLDAPPTLENPSHVTAEKPTDPRLRGRTSLPNAAAAISPIGTVFPPHAFEKPESPAGVVMSDDTEDFMHGSIEGDLEMAKQGVPKLDLNRMILVKEGKTIDKVFLQIPKRRSAEMHLLAKKLEAFHCKIYTSRTEGHWELFAKAYGKCCLIVVHPSELFQGTLRGLQHLLNAFPGVVVFSVGVQHEQCIREEREPAYEAQRLFPYGNITFITDDAFVYYPEAAREIIEKFLDATKDKAPGAESSKIGARPGVKDWLLRLANKKWDEDPEIEDEKKDPRWIKCCDAICRLCPIDDEDPYYLPDRSVPMEHSHLWSIDEEHLPSFKGRWENGDEEGATEYMAELFAGEACAKAWKYRRFFFVYQRPGNEKSVANSQGEEQVQQEVDPHGWMKRWSHVTVATPDSMRGKKK